MLFRSVDSGNGTASAIGFLASLVVQGAMQAADRPDTRTWSFMPAYVWVARIEADDELDAVEVLTPGGAGTIEHRLPVTFDDAGRDVVTVRIFR